MSDLCMDGVPTLPVEITDIVIIYSDKDNYEVDIFIQWVKSNLDAEDLIDFKLILYNQICPDDYDLIDYLKKHCMIILVFLTDNFCEEEHLTFITKESFTDSRLGRNTKHHLFPSENVLCDKDPQTFKCLLRKIQEEKKYMVRPVHTQNRFKASYKIPTGLLTTRGIDFYDDYRIDIVKIDCMKKLVSEAIQKRRYRERSANCQSSSATFCLQQQRFNHRENPADSQGSNANFFKQQGLKHQIVTSCTEFPKDNAGNLAKQSKVEPLQSYDIEYSQSTLPKQVPDLAMDGPSLTGNRGSYNFLQNVQSTSSVKTKDNVKYVIKFCDFVSIGDNTVIARDDEKRDSDVNTNLKVCHSKKRNSTSMALEDDGTSQDCLGSDDQSTIETLDGTNMLTLSEISLPKMNQHVGTADNHGMKENDFLTLGVKEHVQKQDSEISNGHGDNSDKEKNHNGNSFVKKSIGLDSMESNLSHFLKMSVVWALKALIFFHYSSKV